MTEIDPGVRLKYWRPMAETDPRPGLKFCWGLRDEFTTSCATG